MLIWNNYINKNKAGSDCQLVTAVNAYYYLTGDFIDDDKYEELADLCCCRTGAAIKIEKVWDELGIEVKDEYDGLDGVRIFCPERKIPLPIEVSIWHKHYGFHSVLIVDHEPKTACYRITNFDRETTTKGWLFAEDMYKWEASFPCLAGRRYRLFGLKEE